MSTTNTFPSVLDSTMISTFRKCPHKFWWEYIQQIAPVGESIDLIAGAAFADALAAAKRSFYEQHRPADLAAVDGLRVLSERFGFPAVPEKKQNKDFPQLLAAYEAYLDRYPLGKDTIEQYITPQGKALVEFTFAVPLPIHHPETGNPLLYSGKFDWIGKYKSLLWCMDEKTTGQMGPTWSNQWDLRSQFIGYCWGARQYGLEVAGTMVRGVCLHLNDIKLGEAIVYAKPWLMERWYYQLLQDIERMIRCWQTQYWDYDLGDACASFGGCAFHKLCSSADPAPWIQLDYETRVWNPLAKEEF